eukprot:TRINITY_DN12914_c0_g1_i1.p1 TRINITY_DN12914_c0_g1~~TRINITY_DN12914_c0_g1_i1.p1  ORF type:complete len:331 (+),score=81.62 TRINITY_DN12914_c0_g1_i1:50-1042(+)
MSPTNVMQPRSNGAKSKRQKAKSREAELDRAAQEMLSDGRRGELLPVWVKSSPIVVPEPQVSLQAQPEPTKMEHAPSMIDVQIENLLVHERLWGRTHPITLKYVERLIKTCNSHGTSMLMLGDTRNSLVMFQKANEILGAVSSKGGDSDTRLELRCLTHSNLAWYYFCTKQFLEALKYAQKCQSSAHVSKDQQAVAAAHLNIGCCISMLGRHEGAMNHATKALYLLQADHGSPGPSPAVSVCLHNIAVEQIHLFREGEAVGAAGAALASVTDALEIAKQVLDPAHAWLKHFKRTFKAALKMSPSVDTCLLYTSDAADEEDSVDLGGRRII